MTFFTKSPIRNIWRLLLVAWLLYVAISMLFAIIGKLPIEPADKFFGFDLVEPSLFVGSAITFFAFVITAFIYVVPALILWAVVEDKFWPQPGVLISIENNRLNS